MKVLPSVVPTPEQLTILKRDARSLLIVRGAAGSGKTTTALLRLKYVVDFWQKQFARDGRNLNVLVLTYNRTLAGYVEALAREQVTAHPHVTVTVETFDKWAKDQLDKPDIVDHAERDTKICEFGASLGLDSAFLLDEFNYATGRFLPAALPGYLTIAREGRGTSPPMPRKLRERLLAEVVEPFSQWKIANKLVDFNDMAVILASKRVTSYDVVVVDEAQDFHANRVRAIRNQLSDPASLTFVLDAAQRIYPHAFRWKEVGIEPAGAVQQLTRNYRNTKQIAAFAQAIVEGMELGDDGSIPDFKSATSDGPVPNVVVGRFGAQMTWAIDFIDKQVDLKNESVAFLHPLGHGWFKETRAQLDTHKLKYNELSGSRTYPLGPINVALSTMHSAKGLEFDHVFILGLSGEVTRHGAEDGDTTLERLRRLLAMAVGRAKRTVAVGYKSGEKSDLVGFFKRGTYTLVKA